MPLIPGDAVPCYCVHYHTEEKVKQQNNITENLLII